MTKAKTAKVVETPAPALTFRKRKLRDYQMDRLATAIADKAVQHLEDQWKERKRALDEQIYLALFESKSRSEIEERAKTWPKSLCMRSTRTNIWMRPSEDTNAGSLDWTLDCDGEERIFPRGHISLDVRSSLYRAAIDLRSDRTRQQQMHGRMKHELANQIETMGDTHTVANYWPEVVPLLNEMFGEQPRDMSTVTTPLDVLLGKFLPALPAPAAATGA